MIENIGGDQMLEWVETFNSISQLAKWEEEELKEIIRAVAV